MVFKFVARVVLTSFLIQTVWPCFIWAAEVETPYAFSQPLGYDKRLDTIFFADNSCLPKSECGDDSKPHKFFPDEINRAASVVSASSDDISGPSSVDHLSEKSASEAPYYYDGKNYVWSSLGYMYVFQADGTLCVSCDDTFSGARSSVLSLCNPNGNVILQDTCDLEELLIQASGLVIQGSNRIGHLGVTSVDGQETLVTVPQGSNLYLNSATLNGSLLHNTGNIFMDSLGLIQGQKGAFINSGSLEGSCIMSLDKILNSGTMTGDDLCFYTQNYQNRSILESKTLSLTTDYFVNEGAIKGSGSITCINGVNRGSFHAIESFDFTVEKKFEQEVLACLAGTTVTFNGNGHINLGGKVLLDGSLSLFSKSAKFQVTDAQEATIHTLRIGQDMDLLCVDDGANLKGENISIDGQDGFTFQNDGTVDVRSFIQSKGRFINGWQFKANTLDVTGSVFLNQEEGEITAGDMKTSVANFSNYKKLTVCESAMFHADQVLNRGKLQIDGSLRGKIDTFINQGSVILKEDVEFTGTRLVNEKDFEALAVFDWSGQTLHNMETGFMALFDNRVEAEHQLINQGVFLWTHNTIKSFHFLNMGWMEWTQDLKKKGLPTSWKAPSNQSREYKKNALENRGILKLLHKGYTPRMASSVDKKGRKSGQVQHWINTGEMYFSSSHMDTNTFDNRGTVHFEKKSEITAQTLENVGLIAADEALTIETTTKGNYLDGKVVAKGPVTIKGAGAKTFGPNFKGGSSSQLTLESQGASQEINGHFQAPKLRIVASIVSNKGKLIGPETRLDASSLINSGDLNADLLMSDLSLFSNHGNVDVGIFQLQKTLSEFLNYRICRMDEIKSTFGVKALKKVHNRHTLHILNGHMEIGELKDSGLAKTHLPQVTLHEDLTVDGSLTLEKLAKADEAKDGHLYVKGKARIRSGALGFSKTTVEKLLELGGNGSDYQQSLGVLTVQEHAVFRCLGGVNFLTGDIINEGIIESEGPFSLGNFRCSKLGKWSVRGELTFKFPDSYNVDEFLARELCNFSANSCRIVADRFENNHEWTFPKLLTLDVKNFVNNATLTTDNNLVIRCDRLTQGAKGELKVHGALDVEATEIDNSHGKIQAHESSRLKAKRIKVGAPVGGGRFYGRNGAHISCDRNMELDGEDGIELNFGEINTAGQGTFKSKGQFLMNASQLRVGGIARFQVNDALIKMNDIVTNHGETVCDWRFWHNQWRQHFTSEGSSILCQSHVYFELASKVSGNLTLIASNFAAMGNVYDHDGMKRTRENLGTFQLQDVACYEHAEKRPGDKFGGYAHDCRGTQHSTFSTSGHIDTNFAAYFLGAAKIAAASASFTGGRVIMDGASGAQRHTKTPSVIHDLTDGLNLLLGGATTYRDLEESPDSAYSTGLKAGTTLKKETVVIAAPRSQLAYRQKQLDEVMRFKSMLDNPTCDKRILRFMMDNFTMVSALQAAMVRDTHKGYIYPKADGLEHIQKLLKAAQKAAQKATGDATSNRMVALEDVTEAALSSNTPVMVHIMKEVGEETVLSPLLVRPPQATDAMLQKPGASFVTDDGGIHINMTEDVYLQRTNMMARRHTDPDSYVPAPITIDSGTVQTHKAVAMDGSLLHFKGTHGVHAEEDHDVTVTQTPVDGGMSTTTTYTSVGNRYKASENVVFETSEGSISLQHLVVDGKKLIAKSPKGHVAFLLGNNHSQTVTTTKKSTGLHTSTRHSVDTHHTHVQSTIHADIEVETTADQKVIVQEIAGHATQFLNNMSINGVKATVHMIDQQLCQDEHTHVSVKNRSLTALCGGVIALAVGFATHGAGASLLGASGAVASAASNAGFSALCSKAAVSCVDRDFNLGAAVRDVVHEKTLKSIAIAAATAGATAGLGEAVGLSADGAPVKPETFADKVAHVATHAGVSMAASTGVHVAFGERFDDALKQGIRVGAADVVQGVAAQGIGDMKQESGISSGVALGLHGIAGAGAGAILGGRSGILPGAVGAMVGEGVAEITHGTLDTKTAAHVGKFSGSLAAAAVDVAQGLDGVKGLSIGAATASTAVENNFMRHAKEGEQEEPDTDDEAEESSVGKFRKKYTDAAKSIPGAKAVEAATDAVGEQASWVYSEDGYVKAKLAWSESLSGKPLTPTEKEMLAEGFRETYQAAKDANQMLAGVAVVIPGRCAEWFLRNTGLTDKGTARATGQVLDDALGVTAVGSVLGSMVTGVGKGVSKVASVTSQAQRKAFQKAMSNMNRRSVANALRLRTELAFRQAGLLNTEGKLTEKALAGSEKIRLKEGIIKNRSITDALTRDGSRVEDWAKFKTESVNMPNGQRLQIHYYRNTVTGRIDHVTPDFKVKGRVEP